MAFSKGSSEWNKRAKVEYEVQHFGMSAKALAEDIVSLYNGSIEAGLDGLVYYILNEKKERTGIEIDENEERKARKVVKRYEQQVIETGQVSVRSIKDYCEKKVFVIPDNIVLPEDRVQEQDFQESLIDQKHLELLERLKALRYMEAVLEQELEDMKKVIPEVSDVVTKAEKVAAEMKNKPDVPASKLEQLLDNTKSVHNEIRTVVPEAMSQENNSDEDWEESTPPSAETL